MKDVLGGGKKSTPEVETSWMLRSLGQSEEVSFGEEIADQMPENPSLSLEVGEGFIRSLD